MWLSAWLGGLGGLKMLPKRVWIVEELYGGVWEMYSFPSKKEALDYYASRVDTEYARVGVYTRGKIIIDGVKYAE